MFQSALNEIIITKYNTVIKITLSNKNNKNRFIIFHQTTEYCALRLGHTNSFTEQYLHTQKNFYLDTTDPCRFLVSKIILNANNSLAF